MSIVMGPRCARTVPLFLLVPRQPARRGAAFAWDTHIKAPHARTIASHPTNVRRGMRSASRRTAHNQEAQQREQATTTHARVRGSKSPRSTVESRGGHISTGSHATKQAREVQFGATNRDRAMTLPIKSTKTAIRVVGEDVGGSLQHAP